MDQRERANDLTESLRAAMDGRQASLWTALPGVVQSYDATAQTAVVQPTVQGRVATRAGSVSYVDLPLLLDCPVQFPSGGGCTLTFAVKKGDECLVVFASRCIDAWHQQSGVQPPMEARMHDLSDGFVLLGFRSVPRVLSDVSVAACQLRSDDGATLISLDPDAQTIELDAPGGASITADVSITGKLTVSGIVKAAGFEVGSTMLTVP